MGVGTRGKQGGGDREGTARRRESKGKVRRGEREEGGAPMVLEKRPGWDQKCGLVEQRVFD